MVNITQEQEVKFTLRERHDPFHPEIRWNEAVTSDRLSRDQRLWVVATQKYICGNCEVRRSCAPRLTHTASVRAKQINGKYLGGLFCQLPIDNK